MAIFNTVLENEVEYSGIQFTEESGMDILYEFNAGINKVLAAAYIADIMIETSLVENSNDAKEAISQTVRDMARKAREWFIDFFDKISEWFKKIIFNFKNHVKSIKKLVTDQNIKIARNNLQNMDEASFTISGYKYLSNADTELQFFVNKRHTKLTSIDPFTGAGHDEVETNVENIRKELYENIYSDKTKKQYEQVVISYNEFAFAIQVLKNTENDINNILKFENDTKKEIREAIDILKDIEYKSKMDNTQIVNGINTYKRILSNIHSLNNIFVNEYSTMLNQSFKVFLRAFNASKTINKESFSIFESAYSLI